MKVYEIISRRLVSGAILHDYYLDTRFLEVTSNVMLPKDVLERTRHYSSEIQKNPEINQIKSEIEI
jgi:hypothetical protein|tara:strand:+ start:24 stop:221 length:198 start_codon:yes stop_codon:yes gene_type:complete